MPDQEIRVGTGDSIPSIAKDQGFFWKTIWEHPENAALKAERETPNILYQNDRVFVPEKELKEVACAANERHDFRLKGDPVKFVLQLKRMGRPRKNEEYELRIDGRLHKGKTDGDGKLEVFVPGNAKGGELSLRLGQEKHVLRLSRLDPVETVSGVQQRLNNLGFRCGGESGELTPKTASAIRSFQAKHGLEATGEPDDATVAKLKGLHP